MTRFFLQGYWIAFLLILLGCSEAQYYSQAISGHLSILSQKQPIEDLLENSNTPEALRNKLLLIKDVRHFAHTVLSLPKNNSYTHYVDLKRTYVLTIVTASASLDFQAYEWCYFRWILGCFEYRGFFDKKETEELAEKLAQEGWDVDLGYVRAYSTGEWLNTPWLPDYFKDPLLNTFLDNRSTTDLIATLIHEMAHQVVLISGDTTFNESFAVFVETEGLLQYLQHRKIEKQNYENHLKKLADRQRFRNLLNATYQELEEIYADSSLSTEEKLEQKALAFQKLKQNYANKKHEFLVLSYERWFAKELNNAHLLGVRRYNSLVETFRRLFEQEDRNWEQFFKKVIEVSEMEKSARHTYLNSFSLQKNELFNQIE